MENIRLNKDQTRDIIKNIRQKENLIACCDLNKIYPEQAISKIKIGDLFEFYLQNREFILIDVRSEDEYQEFHLPKSINIPLLNNYERAEVGFLYKKYSPNSAYFHALEIRKRNNERYLEAIAKIPKQNIPIFVYCWRGGQRSSVFSHILKENKIVAQKISGGIKAYRNKIYNLFYQEADLLNFMILSGNTGSGKSEILNRIIAKNISVFDIENAAKHASSLLGRVKFELLAAKEINSQLEFEGNLFNEIIKYPFNSGFPILTESESKRISKFSLPDPLYKRLLASKVIKINSSLEARIARIKQEYFIKDGKIRIYQILKNSKFFKQKIGSEVLNRLCLLLENNRIDEFCEWFLVEYYDKRYADKYQNIVSEVNSDNIEEAILEIENLIKTKYRNIDNKKLLDFLK